MTWNIDNVLERFGEDTLRDLVRDVNDLVCGNAGHGSKVNRCGCPADVWRKLLKQGGYGPEGVEKALAGERLGQKDAVGPFKPYTIHTVRHLAEESGGPLSVDDLDRLLTALLSYRQLLK